MSTNVNANELYHAEKNGLQPPPNNSFRQRYQPTLRHALRKLFKDLLGFFGECFGEDFSAVNA